MSDYHTNDAINMLKPIDYRFALHPESYEPSGSVNFSNIREEVHESTLYNELKLELKICPKYDKLYKIKIYHTSFDLQQFM